jgi:hypothetical protein
MYQFGYLWQRVCLWLYRLFGERNRDYIRYRSIDRSVYFTLRIRKRRIKHKDGPRLMQIAERLADTLEQYLMYGNYLQPCLYVNHLCSQVHNFMCVILETGYYNMSHAEIDRVVADFACFEGYAQSLLEVVDPTTVDADILRCISRGVSEFLDAYDYEYNEQEDAVRMASKIINPNR